ncbi:cupin domain-containing protein [Xanthomonas vesicatoria]|uniref:Cupin domain-containing protein n=2 Tax=Xanthomonas vesicatoria TaxID=56460 RepID=A0ABS8LBP1_9XANT|nr:cupin domain-containing protein [Xanthomonas vesicatoria]EGD07064.1 anti-ECFsigma factor, ChrR [Xanthomonas vesicatoria ATCC 35937]MCC8559694.1 cupin domain-containing protein [Xanthomonas vesicatoria]MCC8595348.1 cupin domain-containing protein [Xanthomonas vesicatoria]MCC8602833.1 cupin domain-containing protein [Xanthomonas vesicatoria]MCC8604132.1 cupin domain-containing protein [Xanthomonas vesicatoria]
MRINADFSRRAIVESQQHQWAASPQGGVEGVMLDRVGGEKARATSIVRYAPDSHFPRHLHPGGEEILVLAGKFSEGNKHFPAGSYLRNPPGSSHRPSSKEGAVIFVKLQQMPESERAHVRIDTNDQTAWRTQGGRTICPLFESAAEQVCLRRLGAGETLQNESVKGAELLVLAGEVMMEGRCYDVGSRIRMPAGELLAAAGGVNGATGS